MTRREDAGRSRFFPAHVAIAVATMALLGPGFTIGSSQGASAPAPPSPRAYARVAQDLLERSYPADGPGAAVLVARGDTVLFRAARGMANVEAHQPLRPESLFRIGSVTKQITAAGLLKLVEAGDRKSVVEGKEGEQEGGRV